MGYMTKDEVLLITSRLKQQGTTVLLAYPVADLVMPIANSPPAAVPFQRGTGGAQFIVPTADTTQSSAGQAMFQVGQPVGATPPGGMAPGAGIRAAAGQPSAPDFDAIKHLIVNTIEPESWDESGGQGHIQSVDTTLSLVIRQTQKVHDEIRDLLQQLRRLQDLQVTVECRFITVDDDFFESVGVNFNFNVQLQRAEVDARSGPVRFPDLQLGHFEHFEHELVGHEFDLQLVEHQLNVEHLKHLEHERHKRHLDLEYVEHEQHVQHERRIRPLHRVPLPAEPGQHAELAQPGNGRRHGFADDLLAGP